MITIAHLITGLQTGGAETMLAKLVRTMDRTRYHNTIISMTDGGRIAQELAGSGIPILSLHMERGVADPRGLTRLVRLLRRTTPDILQTWLYHADLMGTVAAHLAGIPRTVWNLRCSDMNQPSYRWLSRNLPLVLARLSGVPDAAIVNSRTGLRVHESYGYRPRHWELIPNGFDVDRFRPDPDARLALRRAAGVSDDTPLIGLPARLDPMKDHCTFMAAATDLAAKDDRVHFVLVGRGLDPASAWVQRVVGACGIGDRVICLSERHDMERVLAALDVVTLSSAFGEGFPNVLGEAMACGVPCVSTDVGDASAIIGGEGIVVPPRDPVALAVAWRRILDLGPEERVAFSARVRQRIVDHYSLPQVTRMYESFYERLIGPSLSAAA